MVLDIDKKKGEQPSAAQRELNLVQSRYDLLMPKEYINFIRL